MKFHLNHQPVKPGFVINHKNTLLLLGSCFAENIGACLSDSKFKTLINPSGILFNPASICTSLQYAITAQTIPDSFILERDGAFYSFLHHSSFSSGDKTQLKTLLNQQTEKMHQFLKTADVLFITFGTAFVYRHKSLQETVANCHKQPAAVFEKQLLEAETIVLNYSEIIRQLKQINPGLRIIFTVSPVKYLKDGLEENSISKATLLLSISKLVKKYAHCFYFPAFELVNDDLRDYRFYKEDLAHPNQIAIDYVWQKFSETYFNSETIALNQEIQKLQKALNHRSVAAESQESQKLKDFIANQKEVIKKLNSDIEI